MPAFRLAFWALWSLESLFWRGFLETLLLLLLLWLWLLRRALPSRYRRCRHYDWYFAVGGSWRGRQWLYFCIRPRCHRCRCRCRCRRRLVWRNGERIDEDGAGGCASPRRRRMIGRKAGAEAAAAALSEVARRRIAMSAGMTVLLLLIKEGERGSSWSLFSFCNNVFGLFSGPIHVK